MTNWSQLFEQRRRGVPIRTLAAVYGIEPNTIYKAVVKAGEPRSTRGRGRKVVGVSTEPCAHCGARYQAPDHHRHCGPEHISTILPRVLASLGRAD